MEWTLNTYEIDGGGGTSRWCTCWTFCTLEGTWIVEPALKYTALTFRKAFNSINKKDILQRSWPSLLVCDFLWLFSWVSFFFTLVCHFFTSLCLFYTSLLLFFTSLLCYFLSLFCQFLWHFLLVCDIFSVFCHFFSLVCDFLSLVCDFFL